LGISERGRQDLTATTTSVGSVEKLITAACERRLPAELRYQDGDGMIIMGRVRLVDHRRDDILADRPQYLDDEGTIPARCPITMHLTLGGSRYQFDTSIVDEDRTIRINDHQTLPGIALRKPSAVRDSQRRTCLRVSLAGYDPISVDLATAHGEFEDACAVDAERASGWIADLSVGGLSLVADRRVLRSARPGGRYFLSFGLPGEDGEFNMLGSVRHIRAIPNGDSVRISTCFCPWNGNSLAREQRRLSRFIAAHERRLLRRRR
jgi:c-di-GMP-binding flagellar brake protein YcgR